MKKSKRYIALLLAMVFALALLAGCGGGTEEPESTDEATEAPVKTEAPQEPDTEEPDAPEDGETAYPLVDETATFTWFEGGTDSLLAYIDDLDNRVSWKAAEEITNVHIEFVAVAREAANQQFNVLLAAEELPDFVSFKYYFNGSGDEAVDEGYVYDLAQYAEYTPNFYKALESLDGWEKYVKTDSGYIYQLSQVYDVAPALDQGLSVRQDWLDALNMDTPVTYDDFHEMLMAFKTELDHPNALALPAPGSLRFNTLVGGYGIAGYWEMNTNAGAWNSVPFYQIDGVVHCGLLEDEMLEYVTMMNQWFNDGLINRDSYTWNQNSDQGDYQTAILNDQIGLWFCKLYQYNYLADMAVDPNFEVRALADAVKQEGDIIHLNDTEEYEGAALWENGISVSTTCDNPALAAQYLDFFYTEEGGILANYGVEDVSFTYDEDGNPHYTDVINNNPDGLNSMLAKQLYLCDGGVGWKFTVKDDYTDAMYEAEKIWGSNKDAAYNFPKYMSMTSDEQERYNLLWADIKTHASEQIMRFIVGEKPLDEWSEFVSVLTDDMHIQELIDITQAAYDRYQLR